MARGIRAGLIPGTRYGTARGAMDFALSLHGGPPTDPGNAGPRRKCFSKAPPSHADVLAFGLLSR